MSSLDASGCVDRVCVVVYLIQKHRACEDRLTFPAATTNSLDIPGNLPLTGRWQLVVGQKSCDLESGDLGWSLALPGTPVIQVLPSLRLRFCAYYMGARLDDSKTFPSIALLVHYLSLHRITPCPIFWAKRIPSSASLPAQGPGHTALPKATHAVAHSAAPARGCLPLPTSLVKRSRGPEGLMPPLPDTLLVYQLDYPPNHRHLWKQPPDSQHVFFRSPPFPPHHP